MSPLHMRAKRMIVMGIVLLLWQIGLAVYALVMGQRPVLMIVALTGIVAVTGALVMNLRIYQRTRPRS